MKIIKYTDIEPTLFDNDVAKGVGGRVAIGKADNANNFCMRVFELAKGGFTPKHTHEWEHEIFIHSGSGSLFCEGAWLPVNPGNIVFIPGNEEHQFKNVGTDPFIFICLVPPTAPEM